MSQVVITVAKSILYLNEKTSNCIANLYYNQPFTIDSNKKILYEIVNNMFWN